MENRPAHQAAEMEVHVEDRDQEGEEDWDGYLFFTARRSGLAGLEQIGRRAAADETRQERDARRRKIFEAHESGPGHHRDQSLAPAHRKPRKSRPNIST